MVICFTSQQQKWFIDLLNQLNHKLYQNCKLKQKKQRHLSNQPATSNRLPLNGNTFNL